MMDPEPKERPDINKVLERILKTVTEIQNQLLVIFPMHPRTQARITEFGLQSYLNRMKNLRIMEPISYLESLNLMIHSKFVLTDSGGMQEETSALNIPCLVMRENTERVEMVEFGTSILVGSNPDKILNEVGQIIEGTFKDAYLPELWDGHASERIVKVLSQL